MMTSYPKLHVMCQVQDAQGAGPNRIYATYTEDKNVDSITYKPVMTTDRSTLQTGIQSCSKFLESFAAKLNILLHHLFTTV
jgi:hypothetical protein